MFRPLKMSYTTSDEVVVERYEEAVGSPHYDTSSNRSSSPLAEDWSVAETFKGLIVNLSRGVEITALTGSVASAPWPALEGGLCSLAGQLQEPRSQEKADFTTDITFLRHHIHKLQIFIICVFMAHPVYKVENSNLYWHLRVLVKQFCYFLESLFKMWKWTVHSETSVCRISKTMSTWNSNAFFVVTERRQQFIIIIN